MSLQGLISVDDVKSVYLGILASVSNAAFTPEAAVSRRIEVAEDTYVHAFAAIPKDPARVVVVHSGAGHSFAVDAYWLRRMHDMGSGIIYFGNFGHDPLASPFSYSNPHTRNTESLARAGLQAYREGFKPFFAELPFLSQLPFHELGLSKGGGDIVNRYLLDEDHAGEIATGSGAVPIESITLISPRLMLGTGFNNEYNWALRHVIAPLFRGLLFLTHGRFENIVMHVPALSWPGVPPGVPKGHPDRQRLQALGKDKRHLRPKALPLAYGADVFAHDNRVAQRLEKRTDEARRKTPRVLLAIDDKDPEINPKKVRRLVHRFAVEVTQHGIEHHNPFWQPSMGPFLASIHGFMGGGVSR